MVMLVIRLIVELFVWLGSVMSDRSL